MGYVHTLTGYIDNRKKSSHTEATVEVLMEQKSQNFVAGMGTYSTVFLSLVSGHGINNLASRTSTWRAVQLELLSNHLEQDMAGAAKTRYHSKLEPMPYFSTPFLTRFV
jgi:hypothetical protein